MVGERGRVWLTCSGGEASHGLPAAPEADVILEGKEVKQQLQKYTQQVSYRGHQSRGWEHGDVVGVRVWDVTM